MPSSSGTREPILTYLVSLSEFFGSDACVLYAIVDDMHPEEKKREFIKRFDNMLHLQGELTISNEQTDKYDILKFIGVGEAKNQNNWELKYSVRPDKYVIIRENDFHKVIPHEGLTGYGCRTNTITFYPKEAITNNPLRKEEADDQHRRIHPPCEYCLVMPMNYQQGGQSKRVVLRFDIYDTNKQFDWKNLVKLFNIKDKPATITTLEFNNECMCYQYLECNTGIVLEQSDREVKDMTYTSIYKGEKLVNALASIKFPKENPSSRAPNDAPANGKTLNEGIHQLLSHLFFVFNRRTYIGEKAISDRVIYLADAIFKLCYPDLSQAPQRKFSFKQHLEQFQKQETLMLYDLSRYRDHFMHQMHVFVLGYLIINSIGLEYFRKRLQEIADSKELKRIYEQGLQVTDDSVLRIWFLIAFFHDISYALEELSAGISSFVNKMFDRSVDFKMDRLPFEQFISDADKLNDALYEMCAHFAQPRQMDNAIIKISKLQHAYYKMMLKSQDHAVFSALSLLHSKELIAVPNNSLSKFEIYMSALSISFHNDMFNNVLLAGTHTLHFSDYPMEALLLFCDNVQEWGRIKKIFGPDGTLSFNKFSFRSFEYDESSKVVSVALTYDGEISDELKRLLAEFLGDKRAKLAFEPYEFRILYVSDNPVAEHPIKFR